MCVRVCFRYFQKMFSVKKNINLRTLKRHLQSFEVIINIKVIQIFINTKDNKFNAVLDPYYMLMCTITFYLNCDFMKMETILILYQG